MNLNSEAEEDVTMDSLFGQQDPNPEQPLTDFKLIVPATSGAAKDVCERELFGDTIVKNELPNLNAEFILNAEDVVASTRDLVDIRNSLAKASAVSREDAELIDSIAVGFINENKPIGLFTEDKSKTQFSQTMQTLDKEIDARIAILSNNITSVSEKISELTIPLLESLKVNVVDKMSDLQSEIQNLLVRASSSEERLDTVVFNTLLDTSVIQITDSDVDEVEKTLPDFPELVKDKVLDLRKSLAWPSNLKYKLEYLLQSQILDNGNIYFSSSETKNLMIINSNELTISEVGKSDPINRLRVSTNNHNIHSYSKLVTSKAFCANVAVIILLANKLSEVIVNSKDVVNAIMSDQESNLSDKLKYLESLSKEMSKNTLTVISIMAFINELKNLINRLKSIFESCLVAP